MLAHPKASAEPASQEETTTVARWVDVCHVDDIVPGTGAAALVDDEQIAIIRPGSGTRVYALSNFDPFSKAFVISRGIVGDRNGVLKIASPVYKQNFCLQTGRCLDDESVTIPSYETRVVDGRVHVKLRHLAVSS